MVTAREVSGCVAIIEGARRRRAAQAARCRCTRLVLTARGAAARAGGQERMGGAKRGDSDLRGKSSGRRRCGRRRCRKGLSRRNAVLRASAVHVVDRRACAERRLSQKGDGDRNNEKRIGILAKVRGKLML